MEWYAATLYTFNWWPHVLLQVHMQLLKTDLKIIALTRNRLAMLLCY